MAEDILGFRGLFLLAIGLSFMASLLLSCGSVIAPFGCELFPTQDFKASHSISAPVTDAFPESGPESEG